MRSKCIKMIPEQGAAMIIQMCRQMKESTKCTVEAGKVNMLFHG